MTDPSTTVPEHVETLLQRLSEDLEILDGVVRDSSDAPLLLALMPRLSELADQLKIAVGGIDTALRAIIATSDGQVAFLPDGRTLTVGDVEPKRRLTTKGRAAIHQRIINRALARAEGEYEVALKSAIADMEALYWAPATMPKWTPLADLGFSNWDEVSEERTTDVVGKVVVR